MARGWRHSIGHEWRQSGPAGNEGDFPPRPDGELVWLHAGLPRCLPGLRHLAERLSAIRPGTSALLTVPPGTPDDDARGALRLPADSAAAARAFLARVRPDALVWAGGNLMGEMLIAADRADIQMILVDAEEDGFPAPRLTGRFGRMSGFLGLFDAIFSATANAGRILSGYGVGSDVMEVAGRLQTGEPLPWADEAERRELAEAFAARDLWLAGGVVEAELDAVLAAHRLSQRFAPRQLLVLQADEGLEAEVLEAAFARHGLRAAHWDRGESPDDMTEVLVVDSDDDLGLWLRVAPICFHGATLAPGAHGGRSPYAAAALGAAVLAGPVQGPHADLYRRLSHAGGARILAHPSELADAIGQLHAPDRVAAMARAAWQVVTEGAEVTDRVLDLIQDGLDLRESM